MSAADNKPSAQVLRALSMLEILAGHLPNGLSNKDMAQALNCPASYITRTADVLIEKGWVERTPEARFRVTPRFSQLTFRVLASFDAASSRMADMKRSYTLPT